MKLLTLIAGLTFSIAARANCPNLTGTYFCPAMGSEPAFSIKLSQVQEGGFWKYISESGNPVNEGYVIADGVARVYTNSNGPSPLTATTCEANDVLKMVATDTDSSGTSTVTTNASINAQNNLLESVIFQSPQGNFNFDVVCTRQ